MRVVSYTPLHYGAEYLRYAVQSVAHVVDRHIILYTPEPSYGHGTAIQCPETEEQLRACVDEFNHVVWHTGSWHSETAHRSAVHEFLTSEDEILLPADADEVWDLDGLASSLPHVYEAKSARNWRVYGFVHLWRSFYWRCTDQMAPVRVIDLRVPDGEGSVHSTVYHFGYALKPETMHYKWAIHGHKNELRKDCDWWNDKFLGWDPGVMDVHPTCVGIWNPTRVFPTGMFCNTSMPKHPYYGRELIE